MQNLGVAYMCLGRYTEARAALMKSDSYINLGLLEYHLEDDASAIDWYREGLEKEFSYDLVFNYATARLRQYCSDKYDDLKYCWQLYESRFQIINAVSLTDRTNWTGGKVDSITVLAEQGIGDNLMFSRYLPYLASYGRVVVQCDPGLANLFKYETTFLNEVETTHAVPMCSLGNLLDYIPPPDMLNVELNVGSQIAIVWRTNNKHTNHTRNSSIEPFLALGNVASIGPDCKDARVPHLASATWDETVESLRNVRACVTVDTAVAHLCGIMGVECYVIMPLLNPDWRWGDSSMGQSNKWYPSVKVIRNKGWNAAIEEVKQCLK